LKPQRSNTRRSALYLGSHLLKRPSAFTKDKRLTFAEPRRQKVERLTERFANK
jgi:hypothetical protein